MRIFLSILAVLIAFALGLNTYASDAILSNDPFQELFQNDQRLINQSIPATVESGNLKQSKNLDASGLNRYRFNIQPNKSGSYQIRSIVEASGSPVTHISCLYPKNHSISLGKTHSITRDSLGKGSANYDFSFAGQAECLVQEDSGLKASETILNINNANFDAILDYALIANKTVHIELEQVIAESSHSEEINNKEDKIDPIAIKKFSLQAELLSSNKDSGHDVAITISGGPRGKLNLFTGDGEIVNIDNFSGSGSIVHKYKQEDLGSLRISGTIANQDGFLIAAAEPVQIIAQKTSDTSKFGGPGDEDPNGLDPNQEPISEDPGGLDDPIAKKPPFPEIPFNPELPVDETGEDFTGVKDGDLGSKETNPKKEEPAIIENKCKGRYMALAQPAGGPFPYSPKEKDLVRSIKGLSPFGQHPELEIGLDSIVNRVQYNFGLIPAPAANGKFTENNISSIVFEGESSFSKDTGNLSLRVKIFENGKLIKTYMPSDTKVGVPLEGKCLSKPQPFSVEFDISDQNFKEDSFIFKEKGKYKILYEIVNANGVPSPLKLEVSGKISKTRFPATFLTSVISNDLYDKSTVFSSQFTKAKYTELLNNIRTNFWLSSRYLDSQLSYTFPNYLPLESSIVTIHDDPDLEARLPSNLIFLGFFDSGTKIEKKIIDTAIEIGRFRVEDFVEDRDRLEKDLRELIDKKASEKEKAPIKEAYQKSLNRLKGIKATLGHFERYIVVVDELLYNKLPASQEDQSGKVSKLDPRFIFIKGPKLATSLSYYNKNKIDAKSLSSKNTKQKREAAIGLLDSSWLESVVLNTIHLYSHSILGDANKINTMCSSPPLHSSANTAISSGADVHKAASAPIFFSDPELLSQTYQILDEKTSSLPILETPFSYINQNHLLKKDPSDLSNHRTSQCAFKELTKALSGI